MVKQDWQEGREIHGNGEESRRGTNDSVGVHVCKRKQQTEEKQTAEAIAQGGLDCGTFFLLGLGASAGASAALGASVFFSAAGAGTAASGAGAACARESEAFAGG